MRLIPLQSGSAGNCVLVEGGGVRVLFDAGISAKRITERLQVHGIEPSSIDALMISHEHSDHISAAGILARRWRIPLYLTEATYAASRVVLGAEVPWRRFTAGDCVRIGALGIETIPTPHDAVDGVVFIASDGRHRLGIMTDFGHVFAWLPGYVESLDAVYLESNYDAQLMRDGPYPPALKRRITGPGGHISNDESAELIASAGGRLRWACLAHLSAANNQPRLVLETHRRRYGDGLALAIAERHLASAPLTLE
jgi:phosphoribosyl 1,2-cyclic phosphodiesterase